MGAKNAKRPQKNILKGFLRQRCINRERSLKKARRKRDSPSRLSKNVPVFIFQLADYYLADNHIFNPLSRLL